MAGLRILPDELADLERRRADLARPIGRLPRGASARRRLEARQAEITRSLLLLETRLDQPADLQAVPEHPETEGHELRYWQK